MKIAIFSMPIMHIWTKKKFLSMGIKNCSMQMLQNIHKHHYVVVFKQ